jgi:hypothetical protein
MKKLKTIFFISLIFNLFTSCGYVKTTTVPKYFKFEKETTFCVTNFSRVVDEKTISDLNYSLKSIGFNTVSYSNMIKALEYKENKAAKYKNAEIEEILSIKDYNSIYEIQIVYKKNQTRNFENNFEAWVVDFNTKKNVLYYINANDKSLNFILNSFAKKLSEKVIGY